MRNTWYPLLLPLPLPFISYKGFNSTLIPNLEKMKCLKLRMNKGPFEILSKDRQYSLYSAKLPLFFLSWFHQICLIFNNRYDLIYIHTFNLLFYLIHAFSHDPTKHIGQGVRLNTIA